MTELIHVQIINDDILVADSRDIAKELGIDHHNLMQTVKTHQTDIEANFGILLFKTEEIIGRGQPSKFVLLTEDQFIFIVTLSRNTVKVVQVKAKLVKAFSLAREKQRTIVQQVNTHLSIIISTDELVNDYMISHIEKAKLTRSFSDVLNLQNHLTAFVDEYKSIEEAEKLLSERKASLKARANTIASDSKSVSLPSTIQSTDTSKITECIKDYLETWVADNPRFTKKTKGKNRCSTSLSSFMDNCKANGLVCSNYEVKNVLTSLGLKTDSTQTHWTYWY